jgi:hypothetical protein
VARFQTETPPLLVIRGVQVFERNCRSRGVTGSHVALADTALFVEIDLSALCVVS